jgi:hypothetical protein
MARQSPARPRPGAPGRRTGRKERSLKILAEIIEFCCFDVIIAIGLPPLISIPLRLQKAAVEAAMHNSHPHPGIAGLIGISDLLVSCAILAWTAMRNIQGAEKMNDSVRQIGFSITFVFGVVAVGLAVWAQNLTFANFSTANSFLYYSIPTVLVCSFFTAGAISFALGMQSKKPDVAQRMESVPA